MRFKATKKFQTLSRANHHQGISRVEYDTLLYGGTVEGKPPKMLINEKYIEKVKKVEA